MKSFTRGLLVGLALPFAAIGFVGMLVYVAFMEGTEFFRDVVEWME